MCADTLLLYHRVTVDFGGVGLFLFLLVVDPRGVYRLSHVTNAIFDRRPMVCPGPAKVYRTHSRNAVSKDALFRRASRLSMMASMAGGMETKPGILRQMDTGSGPEKTMNTAAVGAARCAMSALAGRFEGLPALCIIVGGDEAMLNDALRLVHDAEEAEVDVTLNVKPGMPHIYPLFGCFCPESRDGADVAAAFILDEFERCSPHPDRERHPRLAHPGHTFGPVWPARRWQE